jgi:hypothetical protein
VSETYEECREEEGVEEEGVKKECIGEPLLYY